LYQPTNSVAADSERPVGRGAGGVDDRVVVREQVLARDVLAERDVAVVAEAGVRGGLLVDARDGLDLGVVGGDPGAHEPPRRRQALEHVDLDVDGTLARAVLEQVPGRVEAGGTGSHDCDADGRLVVHRPVSRSEFRCGA
jgi:hypothetical protein